MSHTQSSPIKKPRSIEELKMKYEASPPVFESPKMATKKLKEAKVKQMASMLNSKISQIIKRDSEVAKYATLINDFSQAKEFEDILNSKKPITQTITCLPRKQVTNESQLTDQQHNQPNNTILHTQDIGDFFSWFKQKRDNNECVHDMSNQSEIDEEKQKSAIDKVLEEAIAKLETIEAEQSAEVTKPRPDKNNFGDSNSLSSTTCSAKTSAAEETESGLSSLPKNTIGESPTESQQNKTTNSAQDFEFVKPLKPLRNKKLRKNPNWKKGVSETEANQVTSTESKSDSKQTETKLRNKPLFMQPAPREEKTSAVQIGSETVIEELYESLMRVLNSPRKIKSIYTLADLETPLSTPRTFAKLPQLNKSSTNVAQFTDTRNLHQ